MSAVSRAMPDAAEPVPHTASMRQAAEWFAQLQDEQAGPADQQQWRQWLAASVDNRRAWQRVEAVSREFAAIDPAGKAAAARVLTAAAAVREGHDTAGSGRTRRAAVKALALLIPAGLGAWLVAGRPRLGSLFASHRTAVGEQRQVALADGSIVWLNTASAADVDFDDGLRRLRLREGEILVQTRPDRASPARPFVVDTAHGRLQALGTRFLVRQRDASTDLSVYEGAVRIDPAGMDGPGASTPVITAGQRVRFDRRGLGERGETLPGSQSRHRGSLLAEDMRLDDFLAELARYRPGHLVCDPAVGGLRVVGSFRLHDTDAILDMIEKALPVRVRRLTPWWVRVGPA